MSESTGELIERLERELKARDDCGSPDPVPGCDCLKCIRAVKLRMFAAERERDALRGEVERLKEGVRRLANWLGEVPDLPPAAAPLAQAPACGVPGHSHVEHDHGAPAPLAQAQEPKLSRIDAHLARVAAMPTAEAECALPAGHDGMHVARHPTSMDALVEKWTHAAPAPAPETKE